MEAFDTNVVVRLLVHDDEEQCRQAESAWRNAVANGGAWLATVVLVETIWVLRVAYKFDRATSASALRRLISSEGAIVEDAELVSTALDAFEQGPADFSDYVILESARREGALPLVTFDVALSKTEGTRVL